MNKVEGVVVQNYFWKGMKHDVRRVVKECECMANKSKVTVVATLKPTLIPMAPFDLVALNLMTLTGSYAGNCYLIVAQDYLSKWPEVKVVPNKSAETVAAFIEEYIFQDLDVLWNSLQIKGESSWEQSTVFRHGDV